MPWKQVSSSFCRNLFSLFIIIADSNGIKLMQGEYFKILEALKEHPKSCVALKPTSLIDPQKIAALSQAVANTEYSSIDFDKIIKSNNVKNIASPFIKLTEEAVSNGTRILIDAEQSNLQPGVDILAIYLMSKFNKKNKSHIYNTYQLYLKDSPKRLFTHKTWLQDRDARMAAKLVRGAYLSYEKNVQNDVHINYKICTSKNEVDHNYNDTATILVSEDKSDLVVASHNLESIRKVRNILQSKEIKSKIEFGYLMGFGDRIREVVENSGGFLEYVPYGPVEVKIPYLLRRLEENIDVFSQK